MAYSELEETVIDAWIEAACKLRFRMHPKFRLKNRYEEHETLFFLPDHGGPKGMVVAGTTPPEFAIEKRLSDAARRAGLFVSFINLEVYRHFKEAVFTDALNDWKYPYERASDDA